MGVPLAQAPGRIDALFRDMQKGLFDRAKAFRDASVRSAESYDQFKTLIEAPGFVWAHWDGTRATEDRVQQETRATIRCIPFDGPQTPGKCMVTGAPSSHPVLFARAY